MANDSQEMVKKVFNQNSARVDTNKGEEYYNSLFERAKARLSSLRSQPALKDIDLMEVVESEGVNRRDFMKWASATTATLMLPPMFTPLVAEATELMNRVPVIWIELQDCAGNSEALLRSSAPTVDDLLFDVLSLEFHETIMAASGHQADAQLEDAIHHFKGKYLLFVEGAIPTAMNGQYGTIGASGETFQEHLMRLSKDAAAVVAVGSCATYGGIPAAAPNPTGAVGVMDLVKGKPVINIPACPANPANMVGVVLHYVLTGQIPELDSLLRPKFAFGYRIHDNCERRAHFDAGEYVEEFGDEGAKKGYCLYKVGCKGPYTFNNCSKNKFNSHMSWPIQAGHGCIGCSEPDFWDTMGPFEEPVADRLYDTVFGGMGADATADKIGVGLLTATAVGIAAHAVLSKVKNPKDEQE
jgi:quinone-reactive Ni/Fe-hydrogenase small subunit